MPRTKDERNQEENTENPVHETVPHNRLEEEQVNIGGARASAVVFYKFVF